jgi:hypothetical protein
VDVIPEGSVVLPYPYPDMSGPDIYFVPPHNVMLEQAASGMRFKLIGGYGWMPSPTGSHGAASPAALYPRSVQEVFDAAYWASSSEKPLLSRASATADLRALLTKYDVNAVILQPVGGDPTAVLRYVTGAIGCPVYFPDVAAWTHVKQRLAERISGKELNSCGRPLEAAPQLLSPANRSTMSGGSILDASANAFLRIAGMDYYVSGGSLRNKLIGRGVLTQIGWLAWWNTRTVPNGRYVLRSVAVDSAGARRTSSGRTITVKN